MLVHPAGRWTRLGVWLVVFGLGILAVSFPVLAQEGPTLRDLRQDALREALPDTLLRPIGRESRTPRSVDRILAVVENSAITMSDYQNRFGDTRLKGPRLQTLIEDQLIRHAARKNDILLERSRVKKYVDDRIDSMIAAQGRGAFDLFLRGRNLTEDEYRKQLLFRFRDDLLRTRVLARMFPEANDNDTSVIHLQTRARMMLLEDSGTAWSIYQKLQKSPRESTWNSLYDTHSAKLNFMGEHGDLGWFQWGHFAPEIESQVYRLSLFGISKPFPIRGRYALVYRTGQRTVPRVQSDTETILRFYRRYREQDLQQRLMSRLRRRYTVEIPESVRRQVKLDDTRTPL